MMCPKRTSITPTASAACRAKREGASYLFYTKDEQKRVDTLLRLTRNTDDCRSVHFDFNHEKLVVEEKQNVDKFNIKCYF